MDGISKKLTVEINAKKAFRKFVHEFNQWWPKEYTWSQDFLREIKIDPKIDGLCTEIGPYGFRIDWGRVTNLTENESIEFKWQISPKREPIPNPDAASDIKINFTQQNGSATSIEFEHYNFRNHADGGKEYQEMMDSEYGWDYILGQFINYCKE
ncbi:SRPBCC domain-containing protein [Marivirga sp. S37H4]|uniref:SRPBCC domain-containing protein n=1 Tax=Marivirga aurantiaca TaxID=2802615 RepID=A0A935CAQ2_9BACT|nr:SRPBCC domain-containing protein [Marivirga aurantiaca]MBK6266725.1 SRPBCC domain-containing protein [Marivirga aurantiaca]